MSLFYPDPPAQKPKPQEEMSWHQGLAILFGLFGLIGGAIVHGRDTLITRGVGLTTATQESGHDSNIRQLANDLFSNHVFAFELTSVLLVIAVVATVLLARRPRSAAAADIDAGFKSKTGVK